MAHLDLNPKSIVLDAEFNLKIANFEQSYNPAISFWVGKGSKHFRA